MSAGNDGSDARQLTSRSFKWLSSSSLTVLLIHSATPIFPFLTLKMIRVV